MTAITYVAKRNLAGGHSASTSYNLEPDTISLAPSDIPDVKQSFTLDGTPETVFNNLKEQWQVTTTIIGDADYGYREDQNFMYSIHFSRACFFSESIFISVIIRSSTSRFSSFLID